MAWNIVGKMAEQGFGVFGLEKIKRGLVDGYDFDKFNTF
jgi:hypothetical protein